VTREVVGELLELADLRVGLLHVHIRLTPACPLPNPGSPVVIRSGKASSVRRCEPSAAAIRDVGTQKGPTSLR
jgi:hypothetical protein